MVAIATATTILVANNAARSKKIVLVISLAIHVDNSRAHLNLVKNVIRNNVFATLVKKSVVRAMSAKSSRLYKSSYVPKTSA